MAGLMYFGTKDRMTWVKCPDSGMGRGRQGYTAEGTYLNGGAWVRNSRGTHNYYELSWNFLRADQKAEIRPYLDGVYGDGLLYFLDPFAIERNALPTPWATPAVTVGSSTSLLRDEYPVAGTQVVPTSIRTNYARNPEAVGPLSGSSVPLFADYAVGTGEVGTTTLVAAGSDGPVMPDGRVLGYARRTVTTAKTAGSGGWRAEGAEYRLPLAGTSDDRVTISAYLRFNAPSDPGAIHRSVRLRSSGWATTTSSPSVNNTDSPVIALPMNQWVRVSVTYVPAGSFNFMGWWVFQSTGSNAPAGATIDIAGLMVEKNTSALGTYLSGNSIDTLTVDNSWTGAANASASTQSTLLAGTTRQSAVYTLSSTSQSKTCYLPVPSGYTLHLGGFYTRTGTAAVTLVSDAGVSTSLPPGTSAPTSISVTGSTGYTLKLTGTGTLNLSTLIAQVRPTGTAADYSRAYVGEGHSGCRQSGELSDVGYSSPQALDYSSLSFSLRETGTWES